MVMGMRNWSRVNDNLVTSERAGDSSEFNNLLAQVLKAWKPSKLLADSAYDSRDNYNLLSNLGIMVGIKPRPIETIPKRWRRIKERRLLGIRARGSTIRKKNVIEYSLSPESWKRRVGYDKRWLAEIFFSRFIMRLHQT